MEGEIVATSGLIFFDRPPTQENLSGKEAFVLNMYTVPRWRKKGIATKLLQKLLSFVREIEARRIWLYATKDGQSVYEKAGFVATKGEMLEMDLVW